MRIDCVPQRVLLAVFAAAAFGSADLLAVDNRHRVEQLKPRIVVLTDVSTWETDDSESLVRLLAHADSLEIEGLVFTTGWSLGTTRDDFFDLIHVAINAYEQDLANLRKRSDQTAHSTDESRHAQSRRLPQDHYRTY